MHDLKPDYADAEGATIDECVRKLRALADDTRWRIFSILARAKSEPVTASDLVNLLGVTNYNVSKHARILREAGVISVNRKGKFVYYCLNAGIWDPNILDLGACRLSLESLEEVVEVEEP